MKTLNVIYIMRVAFGALAALIAAVVVDLKVGTPLINGISVALIVYILTFYLLKYLFMNKIEKPNKIVTMGIGAYFLTFIVVWVLIITPSLAAPTAAFTVGTQNPIAGTAVTFDAGQSADPDGTIVKYVWSFGDDVTREETIPYASHTYDTAGEYIVSLTVVDDNGISISTSQTVIINING